MAQSLSRKVLKDLCFECRRQLIQLGVGYSSNNAGDGPRNYNYENMVRTMKPFIHGELTYYFNGPSYYKTTLYRELVNVSYKMFQAPLGSDEMNYWFVELETVQVAIKIFQFVALEAKYKLDQVKMKLINGMKNHKVFMNPDGHIQLGVEYSSNNAGDGPDLYREELSMIMADRSLFKTTPYVAHKNLLYKHRMKGSPMTLNGIILGASQIVYAFIVIEELKIFLDIKFNRKLYKAFINPDGSVQLGVAYSSNNAGDGPFFWYSIILVFVVGLPSTPPEKFPLHLHYIFGMAYLVNDIENWKNSRKIASGYTLITKPSTMKKTSTETYFLYLVRIEFCIALFNELFLLLLPLQGTYEYLDFLNLLRGLLIMYGRSKFYQYCGHMMYNYYIEFEVHNHYLQLERNKIRREKESMSQEDYRIISYQDTVQTFSFINDIPEEDKKFYESLLWYAASLKRSKTITDIFFASAGFYQMISENSIYTQIANSDFVEYFQALFETNPLDDSEPETQSLETLRDFRMFLGNYEKIKESEVYCKIKRFIIYTLCKISHLDVGINFQSFGYTKLEEVTLRRKHSNNVDFVYILLDTITFLGEKGYEIYHTGRFDRILHNSSDYTEWYEKVYELRKILRDIDQNPDFVESSFLADLNDLIEKGKAIKKFSKSFSKSDKMHFLQIFSELEVMEIDYNTKRRAREPRKVPFSLLVEGDSGIGKTTILDILCVYFAQINGLRTCPTYRYTKNAFAEFWDNFSTYMHTVILDDIAFMKPDATMGGDPSCMEFLQIINAVPYVPNQAALENKGKTPLKAELVIGTTNTRHLNAHHYFSCPSAAQRRFPFIVTAEVKPQYRHEGAITLDSTKVPMAALGDFPDYWTWSVSTVKPIAGSAVDRRRKLGQETKILDNVQLLEFLKWYQGAIKAHNASQQIMLSSLNRLQDVSLCLCGYPLSMCQCQVQTYSERIDDVRENLKLYTIIIAFFATLWHMRVIMLHYIVNYLYRHSYQKVLEFFHVDIYSYVDPRIFMRYLGEKAEGVLNRPKKLILITTVALTCLVVYKMYKGFSETQSFTEEKGKECSTKTEDEREDIWYKSDYSLSAYDMMPASLSSHGLTRDDFKRLVNKNIVRLMVREGSYVHRNNAFCIYGHIYAVNRHFIKKGLNYLFEIIQSPDMNGINGNVKTCLTESDVLFFDETNDLAFVQILCLPPKKDLRKYLIKDSFEARTPGFLQVRDFEGKMRTNDFKGCEHLSNVRFPTSNINMERAIEFKPKELTQYGDCGAPLILESEMGFVIAGMHCILADKTRPVAVRFLEKDIRACIERFENDISEGYPRLQSATASFELGDLSKRSVVRFAETGSAYVYGSTEKFRSKPKTRVEPTLLSDTFKHLGFMPKVTQPVMKGWEPWRNGLLDMVKCDSPIRTDILEIVKESFKKDILENIDLDMLKEQVHKLTDFETINGAPGVKFIDKINRNTSAGAPWNKSKKFMMHAIPPMGETLDPVDLNQELKDRINEALECYKNGERYHFLYKAHLKDEPISFTKAEAKKTRIFCGASVDSTFITRKYYLAAVRFIQNNRYVFENAVGINVDSIEWDDMYHYLTYFGTDEIIAGDFSAYDKTMKAVFLHAVFDLLDWLLFLSGNYKEEDKKILYGIREDLIYSTTDFNGDLIEFFGKNPSGNALTVILNGLVNCLYNRYAYYLLNPENECESFKENVRLMVYGDDNIIGVNAEYVPWYNHTALVFAYEKMGIKYTMAEKTAKSVPYIKITEATFLKRFFRYDDTLQCQMAPIEFQSIANSLTMWVRSKSITREQQMLEIMSGALLKFFHYGEKTYKQWYNIFKEIVETTDLKDFVIEAHLKSYSEMVWSFQERRRKLAPYLSYQPLDE